MTLVRFNHRNCHPAMNQSSNFEDMMRWAGSMPANFSQSDRVPANIIESAQDFRIELMVPGFKRDDINIRLDNRTLIIEGKLNEEKNHEGERYARKEWNPSAFKRIFKLSDWLLSDQIEARHDNGVLTVIIPKKEEIKPKPSREINIQ